MSIATVPVSAVSVPDAAPEPDASKDAVRFRIAVPGNASNLDLCVSVGRALLPKGASSRNDTLIPARCHLSQACRGRRGARGWTGAGAGGGLLIAAAKGKAMPRSA